MVVERHDDKEYYIATLDENGNYLVYKSEIFKLSELDIITLIKICLIEQRSKTIGKKLLESYRDSTLHKENITKERLTKIGIKDNGDQKPIIRRKPKTR